MANPQKENGYTAISNELFEAIIGVKMLEEPRRIFLAIIRKTYGFQKKQDRIPLSQLSRLTKIDQSHVCRALNWLKQGNFIKRDENGKTSIQKDYEKWLLPGQAVPHEAVPRRATGSASRGNEPVPHEAHSKEIQKKLSKETTHRPKNVPIGTLKKQSDDRLIYDKISPFRGTGDWDQAKWRIIEDETHCKAQSLNSPIDWAAAYMSLFYRSNRPGHGFEIEETRRKIWNQRIKEWLKIKTFDPDDIFVREAMLEMVHKGDTIIRPVPFFQEAKNQQQYQGIEV